MVDNAFIQRIDAIRSAISREAIVSDPLAVDWLKQSQGAVTFLQACSRSYSPFSGRACMIQIADVHAPCVYLSPQRCLLSLSRQLKCCALDSNRCTQIAAPEALRYH
jgi:hypothetical protein